MAVKWGSEILISFILIKSILGGLPKPKIKLKNMKAQAWRCK